MNIATAYNNVIPKTAIDVFNLLPEGTLCEVVENQLFMSPAPNRMHQEISAIIHGEIYAFLKKAKHLGKVYAAPIDVFIDPPKNAFQPDIIFIATENFHLLSNRGIEGAPDLVVEIMSLSNEDHDAVIKKAVYERCGVNEFWLINPIEHIVNGFELVNDKYIAIESPSQIVTFKMFDLSIDLKEVL